MLGVLVGVACLGYVVGPFATVLAPGTASALAAFVTVPAAAAGEFTVLLWLIFKGLVLIASGGRPVPG